MNCSRCGRSDDVDSFYFQTSCNAAGAIINAAIAVYKSYGPVGIWG